MLVTPVSIINSGLGKIGVPDISQIDPPRSPLEKHCSTGYPVWRDAELQKRRWVFALWDFTLNYVDTPDTTKRLPFKFELPVEVIRPLREKHSKWKVQGRFVFNDSPTLCFEAIRRIDEALFDPLFADVLAWRCSIECKDKAAQISQPKSGDVFQGYNAAVLEARRSNAFVIGTEDIQTADDHDTWIAGRWGYEING